MAARPRVRRGAPTARQVVLAARPRATLLRGRGDYYSSRNVTSGGAVPTFAKANNGITVQHREYLTDISATPSAFGNFTEFDVGEFTINPGDSDCFPWLSNIAKNFEQYRVNRMVFEYRSMYSDAVVTSNGSLGSVILATQYNAYGATFTEKASMENYQFSQSVKPSVSVLHTVECAKGQTQEPLYVRSPDVLVAAGDKRMYDLGVFNIATVGIPLPQAVTNAATPLGELWVTYDITFFKPKLLSANEELESEVKSCVLAGVGLAASAGDYYPGTTADYRVNDGHTFDLHIDPTNGVDNNGYLSWPLATETQFVMFTMSWSATVNTGQWKGGAPIVAYDKSFAPLTRFPTRYMSSPLTQSNQFSSMCSVIVQCPARQGNARFAFFVMSGFAVPAAIITVVVVANVVPASHWEMLKDKWVPGPVNEDYVPGV